MASLDRQSQIAYRLMYMISAVLITVSFFLSTVEDLINGMLRITFASDILITDYMEIAGVGVLQQKDYKDGSVVNVADGAKSTMELSGSNVLRYEMADGTSLIVRPSGTEPKVKVYILANGADKEECDGKVAKYAAWAESLKD